VHWDRRLDARVAAAVMGVPHTRRVEWGDGFAIAAVPGSQAHDEIVATDEGFARTSAHAGGVEGGMSSGEPLHLSAVTKLANRESSNDVSPRLVGLTVSSLVALALTEEVLRKFGSGSATEAADNSRDFRKRLIQQFPRD
jgi:chorismate synthase